MKPDREIGWDEYAEREQPFPLTAERELDLSPYEVRETQMRPPPTLMHRVHSDTLRSIGWGAAGALLWLAVVTAVTVWVSR
jgi:hypothetical protein